MNSKEYFCKFCGKICKNDNSRAQHQIRCSKNPDKINSFNKGFNTKGTIPWNKGIKGVQHHSEQTKQKMSMKARMFNAERKKLPQYENYRQHMRNIALERSLGGFHFRKGIYYHGIKLDSSYEVVVAENLDKNNVKWERPGRFPYIDSLGKNHYYTPDFYLPEYDIYLDPKNDYLIENGQLGSGYSDKQKIEWVCEQNNIRVLILDKDHLVWNSIRMLITLD